MKGDKEIQANAKVSFVGRPALPKSLSPLSPLNPQGSMHCQYNSPNNRARRPEQVLLASSHLSSSRGSLSIGPSPTPWSPYPLTTNTIIPRTKRAVPVPLENPHEALLSINMSTRQHSWPSAFASSVACQRTAKAISMPSFWDHDWGHDGDLRVGELTVIYEMWFGKEAPWEAMPWDKLGTNMVEIRILGMVYQTFGRANCLP